MSVKYTQKKHDNGLTTSTAYLEGHPTVTVMVLVRTGSRQEDKSENGLSHFLEHMCFKGTAKRPTSFDITSELDGLGVFYNAYTSEEYTGYLIKGRVEQFEHIYEVVSDIYLNSTFDPKEIETERGVIIEEINMYADDPRSVLYDHFAALVYGDQPAGRTVLGPKENIKAFSRDDFMRYHQAHYVANQTVVAVAGGVPATHAHKMAKKYFANMSTQKALPHKKVDANQSKPAYQAVYKKTDQAHLVFGWRAYAKEDPRTAAAKLLAVILGGGMSSRLFMTVREKMGAAYYVGASIDTATEEGLFTVYAGIDKKRWSPVIAAILTELQTICENPIPEDELDRAKEQVLGSMAIGLETSNSLATFYGLQALLRSGTRSPQQVEREIKKVTTAEVQAVAKDIFKLAATNFAILGPFKSEQAFKMVIEKHLN